MVNKKLFWNIVSVCSVCAFLVCAGLLAKIYCQELFLKDACVVDEPAPCTIAIDGVIMSYVETDDTLDDKVGLWRGSDSVSDGGFGYFIGHDWTAFGVVAELEAGDPVTVMDASGETRTYYVFDSFDMPDGSYWSDISARVEGHGESIAMQTCIEGDQVRIVLAK